MTLAFTSGFASTGFVRILFAIFMLVVVSLGNFTLLLGQTVASYNFTQSSGTYTAITGGTSHTAGADDVIYGGTANLIPFTFVYRGNNYTSLRMSTNGFITLGNAITPAKPPTIRLFPIVWLLLYMR